MKGTRNKEQRVECCRNSVTFYEGNSLDNILKTFAVEDESWGLFNTPLTKEGNKVWVDPSEPRPRVVRPFLTHKKTMLLFMFTGDGKLNVEAFEPGKTVTAEVYIEFLRSTGDKWRT